MADKTASKKQVKPDVVQAHKPRVSAGPQIEMQPILAPAESALPLALQRLQTDPAHVSSAEINVLQRTIGMRATRQMAASASGSPPASAPADAKASLHRLLAKRGIETQADPVSIQRDEKSMAGSFETGPAFESRLHAASSSGGPIPGSTRQFMESRFQQPFNDVRLHTGPAAVQLNEAVGAQAFTHGRDIFLGAEAAAVDTGAGKHLLAHELTHVVQQTGGVQRSLSGDVLQRNNRRNRRRRAQNTGPSKLDKGKEVLMGEGVGMGGQLLDTIGAGIDMGKDATGMLQNVDTVSETGGGGIGGLRDTVEGFGGMKQGKYVEGGLGLGSGVTSLAGMVGGEMLPGVSTISAGLKTLGGVTKVVNAVTTQRSILALRNDPFGKTKPPFLAALDALDKKIDMWTYIEGLKQTTLGGIDTGASLIPGGSWTLGLATKGVDFSYSIVPKIFRFLGSYTGLVDSNTQVAQAAEQEKQLGIAAMGPAVQSIKDNAPLIGKLKRLALLVEPDFAKAIQEEIDEIADQKPSPNSKRNFLKKIKDQEGWWG